MSPSEIETMLRDDTSWQRPSWPLGRLGRSAKLEYGVKDELHAFTFGPRTTPGPARPAVPAELTEALAILGFDWPVSMEIVKARYKKLAKQFHPDANGGDKRSEEMLKSINLAYATLRGKLPTYLIYATHSAGG
jgi:hypothetical protein